MRMPQPIPRTALIIGVAVLAVVGIGFANYFLRLSGTTEDEGTQSVRAAIEQPDVLALAPTEVMRLAFDESATDEAARVGIAPATEALLVTEDRVYIVDHPEWHVGSRVRWFTREGEFLSQYLAPSGSTLFTAAPDGFAYVLAKGDAPSETVVLVSGDASSETTLAVPLQINSGGLSFLDGEVYVTAQAGTTDLQAQTVDSRPVLVPVTVEGRQATDTQASEGVLEYWLRHESGETYAQLFHADGLSAGATVTQTVTRGSDGVELEVPASATCLGVTKSGDLVLGFPPVDIPGTARPLAGVVAAEEPYSEIAVVGFDGVTRSLSVLPTRRPVYPLRLFAVDGDGFWTLAELNGTVRVLHYEEAGR